MSTVDAVDAHAFAMFTAGWRAAKGSDHPFALDDDDLGEVVEDLDEDDAPGPTPEEFYLAVPDPKARACSIGHVIKLFAHETQALQARVREVDRQAAALDERGRFLAAILRSPASPERTE
jgi:hypothetical protein